MRTKKIVLVLIKYPGHLTPTALQIDPGSAHSQLTLLQKVRDSPSSYLHEGFAQDHLLKIMQTVNYM